MQFKEQSITYPPVHPGTDRTFIRYYDRNTDFSYVFFKDHSEQTPARIFVTDSNVAQTSLFQSFYHHFSSEAVLLKHTVEKSGNDTLIIVDPGESHKTIETVLSIISTALNCNAQRNTVFIGIGGGVICDMTAFAASIFKRGSRVELVPTTLLSMVDAAIGGKTGCDFDNYKNMIGTFFPAQKIHIFPAFIKSLSSEQFRSGLAEVVKTALLYNSDLFTILEQNRDRVFKQEESFIDNIIETCASAKSRIVEQDLTENNIRMQLNFGHTFGHALETCAGLGTVSHGDAVAWGIGRALALSKRLGLCPGEYEQRVVKMLSEYGWEIASVHSALKQQFTNTATYAQTLCEVMKKDKKNNSNRIRFILQKNITDTVIAEVEESDILAVLSHD
jgi:3-dehydroquinate synthase